MNFIKVLYEALYGVLSALAAALTAVMPPVLLAVGIYLGIKLRFFYILHPIKTSRLMFSRTRGGISPFRAASMALAGTLGVGNITGVTAAIIAGGAGAVFWMWVSAFCAMSLKYAETALAVIYRRRGEATAALLIISRTGLESARGRRTERERFSRFYVSSIRCLSAIYCRQTPPRRRFPH